MENWKFVAITANLVVKMKVMFQTLQHSQVWGEEN